MKMRQQHSLAPLLSLLIACSILLSDIHAEIYYVDSSVVDTHPSSATPDKMSYNPSTFITSGGSASVFKSIADINAKSFKPGDHILFRRGQSWSESLIISSSGTAENPILIGAFGDGANPIINDPSQKYGVLIESKSFITIQDIEAREAKHFGFEVKQSSHIVLKNIHSSHSGSSGINIESGSSHVSVLGGSSHHNGGAPECDSNGIGTGGLKEPSSPILIDGVEIYDNVHDNIEMYGPLFSKPPIIVVRNCKIHGGKAGGIRVSGPGPQIILLQSNVIHSTGDHGIITMGAASPVVNIFNNVITNNAASGFYGIKGSVTLKNNVFSNNDVSKKDWGEVNVYEFRGAFMSDSNIITHSSSKTFMTWTNGAACNGADWKSISSQDKDSKFSP